MEATKKTFKLITIDCKCGDNGAKALIGRTNHKGKRLHWYNCLSCKSTLLKKH